MRDSTTYSETYPTDDTDTDLTREFWGDGAGWITRDTPADSARSDRAFQIRTDQPSSSFRLDDTPTSIQAIRDGIAAFRPTRRWRDDSTGPIERTREHGVITPSSPPPSATAMPTARRGRPSVAELPHREASIAELAAGTFEPVVPTGERDADLEPTLMLPVGGSTAAERLGLAGANPAHVRIALVVLALLLAIPLALALRNANERSVQTETPVPVSVPSAVGQPADVATDPAATATADPAAPSAGPAAPMAEAAPASADPAAVESDAPAPPSETAEQPVAAAPESATADTATRSGESHLTESAPAAGADGSSVDAAASVDEPAERHVPDCSLTYTAATGDSWYRIASEAGVTPAELLAQNTATLDTVMFPGDTICLPAGATVPSPPTTVTPTTVAAAPTTSAAPTTTVAPTTTTTVAPIPTTSRDQVQALIREIWPDELEERALEIAFRESRYEATADNGWCCVGVFQIYWTVHDDWLDDYGITTREQLKDARKNITAAYALYQRAGGWGPWGG